MEGVTVVRGDVSLHQIQALLHYKLKSEIIEQEYYLKKNDKLKYKKLTNRLTRNLKVWIPQRVFERQD